MIIKPLLTILLLACATISCGDDASESNDGRPDGSSDLADATMPEKDASAAGSAGNGSEDGGGGMSHKPPPVPTTCEPNAFAGGSCMACVADLCCAECRATYCFSDDFVSCVGICFADSAAGDGGALMSSLELLVECGQSCEGLNYRQRDLLACMSGTPRPIFMHNSEGIMNYIEGEEGDSGVVESCRAECFPSWETMP